MTDLDDLLLRDVQSLLEGETRLFRYRVGTRLQEAFLLRHGGELRAYANICPHWNVDLDLGDGRFFDPEQDRLYCKTHGATFLPATGRCDAGPCLGASLLRLPLRETEEGVWVTGRDPEDWQND